MKNKLLLIDGHGLLFQMFYGMPSRITYNGKPIQAVIGFVGALIKIISMVEPTHILVVFDGEHHNDRTDIDADYKSNRSDYFSIDEADNPYAQLSYIYSALDYMGIKHVETTTCEADDLIASYVIKFKSNYYITISSWDSDFFQLIDDNVCVLRYRGKMSVCCDAEYIMKRYGIAPERYAEFKSLVGDKSDNILGIAGIGPKTAALLINKFGSLENLICRIDDIEKTSLRNAIYTKRELLEKNFMLIKLFGKESLPVNIEELVVINKKISTNDVLKNIGLR